MTKGMVPRFLLRSTFTFYLAVALVFIGHISPRPVHASSSEEFLVPLANQRQAIQARIDTALGNDNKSLDVLTYTLKQDSVGYALLAAALDVVQRGGRARIGYDGYKDRLSPDLIEYLQSKGVQIKAYRPITNIWKTLRSYGVMTTFNFYNMRLHEKVFLTSHGVLLGSANYSDSYFQISKKDHIFSERLTGYNMYDRDIFVSSETIKQQVQQRFEQLWSRGEFWSSHKKNILTDEKVREFDMIFEQKIGELKKLVATKEWMAPQNRIPVFNLRFHNDVADTGSKDNRVHHEILRMINEAKMEVLIENPYILLTSDIMEALEGAEKRGVQVKIYTNSLQGSDEDHVDKAFKEELPKLLKSGFEVFFYRGKKVLHGKIVVADRRHVYWGSYNFDNRSKSMNVENGIFFDSEKIAQSIQGKNGLANFKPIELVHIQGKRYQIREKALLCKDIFSHFSGENVKMPNSILLRFRKPFL